MCPLDPRLDFQDDGGTPDWRRRQINADETPFAAWYRKASPVEVLAFSFFGCLLLGAIVFFGGLLLVFVAAQF